MIISALHWLFLTPYCEQTLAHVLAYASMFFAALSSPYLLLLWLTRK